VYSALLVRVRFLPSSKDDGREEGRKGRERGKEPPWCSFLSTVVGTEEGKGEEEEKDVLPSHPYLHFQPGDKKEENPSFTFFFLLLNYVLIQEKREKGGKRQGLSPLFSTLPPPGVEKGKKAEKKGEKGRKERVSAPTRRDASSTRPRRRGGRGKRKERRGFCRWRVSLSTFIHARGRSLAERGRKKKEGRRKKRGEIRAGGLPPSAHLFAQRSCAGKGRTREGRKKGGRRLLDCVNRGRERGGGRLSSLPLPDQKEKKKNMYHS